MKRYIALLRGINVSGQKKIAMADLRGMLEKMDFTNVATYIQSGNVVFATDEKEAGSLEEKIESGIKKTFGFDVPVLIKSRNDLENILKQNPYTDPVALEKKQVYFVLLKDIPEKELIKAFKGDTYENERFSITDDCVYLFCQAGYGKAKLSNNLIERKLKVDATTRNYRTMMKLLEMADK